MALARRPRKALRDAFLCLGLVIIGLSHGVAFISRINPCIYNGTKQHETLRVPDIKKIQRLCCLCCATSTLDGQSSVRRRAASLSRCSVTSLPRISIVSAMPGPCLPLASAHLR